MLKICTHSMSHNIKEKRKKIYFYIYQHTYIPLLLHLMGHVLMAKKTRSREYIILYTKYIHTLDSSAEQYNFRVSATLLGDRRLFCMSLKIHIVYTGHLCRHTTTLVSDFAVPFRLRQQRVQLSALRTQSVFKLNIFPITVEVLAGVFEDGAVDHTFRTDCMRKQQMTFHFSRRRRVNSVFH